jgi:hypothetical protein
MLKNLETMKKNRKVLSIGVVLTIAGIITAMISYQPSQVLQYIFIGVSVVVGVLGIVIGKESGKSFVRSKYYTWVGLLLFGLAISLTMWATSVFAFINIVGFFLLLAGIVEFVFVQQIVSTESPLPWSLVGLKMVISTVAATGGAWILTMSGVDVHIALLFLGVLFAIIGLIFVQIYRITRRGEYVQ